MAREHVYSGCEGDQRQIDSISEMIGTRVSKIAYSAALLSPARVCTVSVQSAFQVQRGNCATVLRPRAKCSRCMAAALGWQVKNLFNRNGCDHICLPDSTKLWQSHIAAHVSNLLTMKYCPCVLR